MFIHFSIFMIIHKDKGKKFDQIQYDNLFDNIEYNLRELGYGDVSVNKKMKDLNKILYDILLKIRLELKNKKKKINFKLISKYFKEFSHKESSNYIEFEGYFVNFYNYCSKLPLDNMVKESINFQN